MLSRSLVSQLVPWLTFQHANATAQPWARLTFEDTMVGLVLRDNLAPSIHAMNSPRFRNAWEFCTGRFVAKHFDDGMGFRIFRHSFASCV